MLEPKVVNKVRKPRVGYYCTTIPHRKKPRVYQPCDVARIARYCLQDNPDVSRNQLMAVIAKGLGYSSIAVEEPVGMVQDSELSSKQTSTLIDLLELFREWLNRLLALFGIEG
jgi:hypothetical protein